MGAVVLWGVATSAAIGVAGAQVGPSLVVTPDPALAGGRATVTGRGHPTPCAIDALTSIVVHVDGIEVGSVESFAGPDFDLAVSIPDDARGSVDVTSSCQIDVIGPVVDGFSVRLAATTVEVLPAPAEAEPPPQVAPTTSVGDSQPSAPAADPSPGREPVRPDSLERASDVSQGATAVAGAPAPAPEEFAAGPGSTPAIAVVESSASPAPAEAEVAPRPEPRSEPIVAQWVNRRLSAEALPQRLANTVALAGIFAVLIGFPSSLFDATIRRHYDRIVDGVWRRLPISGADRARLQALPDRWAVIGTAIAGASVSILVDPAVALDLPTLWFAVGIAVAVGAIGVVGWLPAKIFADNRGMVGRWRSYPSALLVVLGCVAITRGLGIAPGYLYGLLFAYHVAGSMTAEEDARTFLEGFQVVLVAASALWVVWAVAGPFGDSPAGTIADTALTTFVLAGIQGTLFSLVPWKATPGAGVRDQFPRQWRVLVVASVAAFVLLLVAPGRSLLDVPEAATLAVSVLGFAVFSAVSLGTWWWLSLRPEVSIPAGDGSEAVAGG